MIRRLLEFFVIASRDTLALTDAVRFPDQSKGGSMGETKIKGRDTGRSLLSALIAIGGLAAAPAHALTVSIDAFTVTKGGNAFFADTFGDGVLPPSAPNLANGNTISYTLSGAAGVGPESDGRLLLNTANGATAVNALGVQVREVVVRLSTNTDPSSTLGLKPGGSFAATGLFDLASAVFTPSSNFQVWFRERTQSSSAALGLSQVRVVNTSGGNRSIDFRYQDFQLDTLTTLGSTPLDLVGDPDQILLSLAYNPSGRVVTGGYQYFKSGLALGSLSEFGSTSSLGVNSDSVIAGFAATETTQVPLPGAAWLFGAGLLALIRSGRRSRVA